MILCNLFFIFDPSLRLFSLSWIILFSFVLFPSILFLSNVLNRIIYSSFFILSKEISFNLPKLTKGFNSFLISLFFLVLFYNFLALFPHLFSSTSHLLVTLPLAYTMWVAIISFNLISFFKYFISHFIPLGTPIFLISFIVVVEILSNLIRPLALTFRLTANIIAGHLLISLVRGILISLNIVFLSIGYITQFFFSFHRNRGIFYSSLCIFYLTFVILFRR